MDGLRDVVLSITYLITSCELVDFPIDISTRQEAGRYEVLVRDYPATRCL